MERRTRKGKGLREAKVRYRFCWRDLNSAGATGVDRCLLHLPASLCPMLFTARNSDRVNYGEAGFHKFWDEIWSDKFKSLDLAP